MKHLLLITIAAVLVVGCGQSQQSTPLPESKPAEPVAKAAQPEPPTAKAPDISIHQAVSIHDAARAGNIEAVKYHIAAGTDVNAMIRGGVTPLHHATWGGHKEIVELLIGEGADVNAKSDDGWIPLHQAALGGHKKVAELLITKGADVNAKDKHGSTPLDLATVPNNPKDTAETAELLRKHGGKTGAELKAEGK